MAKSNRSHRPAPAPAPARTIAPAQTPPPPSAGAAPDLCAPDPLDEKAIAVLESEGAPPADAELLRTADLDEPVAHGKLPWGLPGKYTPPTDTVRSVTLELPLLRSDAYARRNLADLKPHRARTLKDLADGLHHEGATVDGKPVRSSDQALAWLLDQLA